MAPLVAQLLASGLSLLGNAVMAKGQGVIEEKLGVKLDDLVGSPEGKIKLAELQYNNEEMLRQFVLAQREQELRSDEMAYKDVASARDMNVQVQISENASFLAKNAAYYLDFLIVGATIGLGALLFYKQIPQENLQIANIMLGSLLALCGTVVSFHRGSTASAAKKDNTIDKLAGVSK